MSRKLGKIIGATTYYNCGELATTVGRSTWYISMMVRAGFKPEMDRRYTLEGYKEWHKQNPHFRACDYVHTAAKKAR